MQAKDEELNKVKEKHLQAEQQLRDMENKHQQVKLSFSVLYQEIGFKCRLVKCLINTLPALSCCLSSVEVFYVFALFAA